MSATMTSSTPAMLAPFKRVLATAGVVLATLAATPAMAQSISLSNDILPQQGSQQRGQPGQQEQVDDTPRADWRSGTYGPIATPPQPGTAVKEPARSIVSRI